MKKTNKDQRVNAPLISIRAYFSIFLILLFLIVGQAFILEAYLDSTLTLMGIFMWYMGICCLLLSLTVGVIKRHYYGKPIQIISKAARNVANGNFDIQIKPIRKDGKKDEIEILIEDFNKMAIELQSTELFKNDFISNVSHEIKTPISIIQSYTKSLDNSELSEKEKKQIISVILMATDNLNSMVTNMLKLNKLENQGILPVAEEYQLGEQLRNCSLYFIKEWEEKKINFNIDVIDVKINYDPTLLELVWNNLISNAIKFTDEEGSVSVTSYRDRNFIYISIADSGCGIKKSDIKKIFDKFYQADLSRATNGNGLGLSLAKKVLDVVNGKIFIESEFNNGSIFTVKLKI